MKIKAFILSALCLGAVSVYAQNFNGLDMNMGNLYRLSDAKTRSISPENFTGEKGKGGMADPVRDKDKPNQANAHLSLIHISEPTIRVLISYAVFWG